MSAPVLARGSLRIVGGRVDAVIDVALMAFDVSEAELLGSRKTHPLVAYRHIAMAAARLLGHSYPSIGTAFGGRDPRSVMNACKRVEADAELATRARIIAEAVTSAPGELF